MAYAVVNKAKVMAKNVDSLNRTGKHSSALEDGVVGGLTVASGTEVGTYVTPATGALTNLWMIASPEIVAINGTYRIGANDPRDFINPANVAFEAFKPQIGDIIVATADTFGGTKGSNGFVVATNAQTQLQWAAAAVSGLSLKYVEDTYLSIGTGAIGSQRVTAYRFEVVAN
jgi:hypothetical protein